MFPVTETFLATKKQASWPCQNSEQIAQIYNQNMTRQELRTNKIG